MNSGNKTDPTKDNNYYCQVCGKIGTGIPIMVGSKPYFPKNKNMKWLKVCPQCVKKYQDQTSEFHQKVLLLISSL